MTQPETARELLHRHGLPEDIIDGALCLHAQELAAQQRKAHDELRPYSHMGLPCKPEYECGARRVIDLIDPTRTPAAVSAAVAPPTQAADEAALAPLKAKARELEARRLATHRAAVLREAADVLGRMDYDADSNDYGYDTYRDAWNGGVMDAADRLRRMADEGPLSPYYEHPECGFHWHGRDGMDIPMRDGQPVCPRCELAKVQKRLDYTQRLRDEVGVECKRRGKIKLEQAETIARLERQLDKVRTQLGTEILRAGQAEAALERIQRLIRRLANHAVGFQDVLDDSDRDPWAKTVGADIAELRRMADETATQTPDAPHPPHDSWLVEWRADGGDWNVAYPTHDHTKALDRLARGRQDAPDWQWRIVRETTTYTVEQPAAGARQDGAES